MRDMRVAPFKKKKNSSGNFYLFSLQVIHVITEKLGSPLGRHQAKRYNQAKEWEKEGFITCTSKENTEDLSQSRVSPRAKLGKL